MPRFEIAVQRIVDGRVVIQAETEAEAVKRVEDAMAKDGFDSLPVEGIDNEYRLPDVDVRQV